MDYKNTHDHDHDSFSRQICYILKGWQ